MNDIYLPLTRFGLSFPLNQLMDTRQAIMDKQNQVDEMEIQLMSSAPDSVQYVVDLRTQLSDLYDKVTFLFPLLVLLRL